MSALALLAVLLVAEGVALYQGQRRLFWATEAATGSRLVAYALAAPGTILHEAAHYIMCLVLGVPAGDQVLGSDGKRARVSFFFPKSTPDGVTLGSVPHARTDPMRQALIAVAPVLLVPPLLLGLTALLLGSGATSGLWDALSAAPAWKQAVWLYVAFSCGQAAFPSPGDHIGVLGAAALIVLGAATALGLHASGGVDAIADAVRFVVVLLAVPAGMAAASIAVFGTLAARRKRTRGRVRDASVEE